MAARALRVVCGRQPNQPPSIMSELFHARTMQVQYVLSADGAHAADPAKDSSMPKLSIEWRIARAGSDNFVALSSLAEWLMINVLTLALTS